ncbi:FG-GAP repeat protein [Streptomyces sp. NPDC005402]|uniref:FG-GAP and VCBS repeat-containing protein n=1 Tax=Streptomyces sp. NPDC005402 TaxID=3155338 RepID=UPI0033B0E15C
MDGDGYGDLVVGDPTATVLGKYAAGYAAVPRRSAHGSRTRKAQVVTQDDLGFGEAGADGVFGGVNTMVTNDLNGGGRADLVTQAGRRTLFVVRGSDKGLTGAAARLTGSAPLAGDVDGDGHTDLVVGPGTGQSEDNSVRVLLGPCPGPEGRRGAGAARRTGRGRARSGAGGPERRSRTGDLEARKRLRGGQPTPACLPAST